MVGHQRGCTVFSYDGVNAYSSINRAPVLPALARYVPSVAGYASNLNTRNPLKVLLLVGDDRVPKLSIHTQGSRRDAT